MGVLVSVSDLKLGNRLYEKMERMVQLAYQVCQIDIVACVQRRGDEEKQDSGSGN
jgi:hypothetical protein